MANIDFASVSPSGQISRDDDGNAVIDVRAKSSMASMPGVSCLNPKAAEKNRVYRKTFCHPDKRVFLPQEEDEMRRQLRSAPDVVTVGMTGYSSLKPEQLKQWGIKQGAYEAACRDLIEFTAKQLRTAFPGVRVKFVHGASDMGVDRAVIDTAREMNLDHFGFNCPEWMCYVHDDEVPVYVAADKDAYADAFVRNADILISAGGRDQSLMHDVTAAIKYGKCLILAPVMEAISNNGGPPARDGNGQVQDATQAFLTCVRLPYLAGPTRPLSSYDDLATFVSANANDFAQQHLISPGRAFTMAKRVR